MARAGGATVVVMIALTATAIGGCGGKSEAEIQTCWNHELAHFANRYANEISIAGTSSQALRQSAAQIVFDDASLYASGHLPSDDTTPEITAHLKAIEAKCGKLIVKRK